MKLRLSNLKFGSAGCVGVCAVGPTDRTHPNKMPFTGTLLILDQASDKPPHGAEGHRIFVPSAVARRRLNTLIDMGVNYQRELDGHAPRHKVGVVTGARISGNKVIVNGFMWQRDFPELKRDMQAGKLGMSMELQDVTVRAKNDPVWYLEDFHFSGATILFKSAAAYTSTSLAAAALSEKLSRVAKAEVVRILRKTALAAAAAAVPEGGRMKTKQKQASGDGQGEMLVKAIAAGVGPALSKAVQEGLEPFVGILTKQQKTISRLAASVDETRTLTLEAAKRDDDETDGEEEVEEVSAAHHEDDDDDMDAAHHDDDDMDAAKKGKHEEDDEDDDEEDDADLDAEMEDLEDDAAEEKPGEINKDAENQGDKTTRTGKVGKAKAMKELVKAAADRKSARSIQASSVIRELYASHRALRTKYRNLKASAAESKEAMENRIEALEAQVEQYAERVDRKTVSAELSNFLAKSNVDVRELRAEGKKLSVAEVDQIFASAPVELDPTTRMWFKNQLLSAELMDQGEIHRGM